VAGDRVKVTVVDLFCGVGGLTHGLRLAGLITPAGNYENLFIWFRLDFRVFNFIMVKIFFNF
jgi:hypothetical protein